MSTALAYSLQSPWMTSNDRAPQTPASDNPAAVLPESDWAAIATALARVRSKVGRPFRDERRTVEAVIWRVRHDARWREIPESFGPWWRAAQLYYRWEKTGLWARLRGALREDGRDDLAALFEGEGDSPGEPPLG